VKVLPAETEPQPEASPRTGCGAGFSAAIAVGILLGMTPENLTLNGDHLHKVSQLLRLAQQYARIAGDSYHSNVQDALADLDEELSDRLAALDRAEQEDRAAAEDSGEAEQARGAYFSRYRAA
jgi:hypothetical protein